MADGLYEVYQKIMGKNPKAPIVSERVFKANPIQHLTLAVGIKPGKVARAAEERGSAYRRIPRRRK